MDAVNPQSHEQAAQEAIAEAVKNRLPFRNYQSVVKQLPMLLKRHGLGQALVCLKTRGGGSPTSAFDLLARQMDRWLLKALGISAAGAVAALASRDSQFYLQATEQAWLFARALRAGVEGPR